MDVGDLGHFHREIFGVLLVFINKRREGVLLEAVGGDDINSPIVLMTCTLGNGRSTSVTSLLKSNSHLTMRGAAFSLGVRD
jgi:hypothetical protein